MAPTLRKRWATCNLLPGTWNLSPFKLPGPPLTCEFAMVICLQRGVALTLACHGASLLLMVFVCCARLWCALLCSWGEGGALRMVLLSGNMAILGTIL